MKCFLHLIFIGAKLVLGERVDFDSDDLQDVVKANADYYIKGNRTVTTNKGFLILSLSRLILN